MAYCKATRAALAALAAGTAILAPASCASGPKNVSVERKNEAAEYSKVADQHFALGNYSTALDFYAQSLDANLSVDNVEGAIKVRSSIGRVYLAVGKLDEAEREFGDALEDALALGDGPLLALCKSNLGDLRYLRGDIDAAGALYAEAEPLAQGDDAILAIVVHNRGFVALRKGDLVAAEAFLLQAAKLNEKGLRWNELGSNRFVLASVYAAKGDLAGAIGWARKALEADKLAEYPAGIGKDLEALAGYLIKAGEKAEAFDLYRRAFGLWLSIGKDDDAVRCLRVLADLAAELGKEGYLKRYQAILNQLG